MSHPALLPAFAAVAPCMQQPDFAISSAVMLHLPSFMPPAFLQAFMQAAEAFLPLPHFAALSPSHAFAAVAVINNPRVMSSASLRIAVKKRCVKITGNVDNC